MGRTLANGIVTSSTFDTVGNELRRHVQQGGSLLAFYTTTYDAVGNRLSQLELDGTRVTWGYDPAYQLIREQSSGLNSYDTTYQYDPAGNRLAKLDSGQCTTHSYNVADELTLIQPPSGQPTTITWDAKGNCLTENAGGAITSCTWNSDNLRAAPG